MDKPKKAKNQSQVAFPALHSALLACLPIPGRSTAWLKFRANRRSGASVAYPKKNSGLMAEHRGCGQSIIFHSSFGAYSCIANSKTYLSVFGTVLYSCSNWRRIEALQRQGLVQQQQTASMWQIQSMKWPKSTAFRTVFFLIRGTSAQVTAYSAARANRELRVPTVLLDSDPGDGSQRDWELHKVQRLHCPKRAATGRTASDCKLKDAKVCCCMCLNASGA